MINWDYDLIIQILYFIVGGKIYTVIFLMTIKLFFLYFTTNIKIMVKTFFNMFIMINMTKLKINNAKYMYMKF